MPHKREPYPGSNRTGLKKRIIDINSINSITGIFWGVQPRGTHHGQNLTDLRFTRKSEQLHPLGARVFYELLIELGREYGIAEEVATKVAKYIARLGPELQRIGGGDRFARAPLWLVGGER